MMLISDRPRRLTPCCAVQAVCCVTSCWCLGVRWLGRGLRQDPGGGEDEALECTYNGTFIGTGGDHQSRAI